MRLDMVDENYRGSCKRGGDSYRRSCKALSDTGGMRSFVEYEAQQYVLPTNLTQRLSSVLVSTRTYQFGVGITYQDNRERVDYISTPFSCS